MSDRAPVLRLRLIIFYDNYMRPSVVKTLVTALFHKKF
ncbi:hypothetical protein CUBB_gp20 [Staphylococcus phage CUB-B]|nr:hypothetical protein CUBB_gp20 [Staphylococcus phage CUB-B]